MSWIIGAIVWVALCILIWSFIAGANFLPDVYAADELDDEPTIKGDKQ